ncbi:hypothetical protein F4V91_00605 [Neorhizobium galegae]|uniref:Uncharacterized protein n=1 Tax=Neorhizobium galegae TaxID=399 RepID=A0A6A1TLK2_NEOGA|nr:hypothetical protein [Neorhizobium galegae]KAB1085066.1 hypothetical protein F4V91_00605 [Neorhizobium galegae]
MTASREIHTMVWRGITIEIAYDPDWLNMSGDYQTAHFDIRSIAPEDAPLPITETGYRSYFAKPAVVAEAGGPVALVTALLDDAAQDRAWKKQEEEARQFTLF